MKSAGLVICSFASKSVNRFLNLRFTPSLSVAREMTFDTTPDPGVASAVTASAKVKTRPAIQRFEIRMISLLRTPSTEFLLRGYKPAGALYSPARRRRIARPWPFGIGSRRRAVALLRSRRGGATLLAGTERRCHAGASVRSPLRASRPRARAAGAARGVSGERARILLRGGAGNADGRRRRRLSRDCRSLRD